MLRRWATIWLLFVFGSATTELGQFLKIPFLVQHYYQHRQEERLSLLQFLSEHYNDPAHNDADLQDDLRLPFKTTLQTPVVTTTLPPQRPELRIPVEAYAHPPLTHYISFVPTRPVCSIFHPPRLA